MALKMAKRTKGHKLTGALAIAVGSLGFFQEGQGRKSRKEMNRGMGEDGVYHGPMAWNRP